MNSERKNPITIEDLLRLKRLERPPEDFWPQFEKELRAKQLAAIVAKRPWWAPYSRIFAVASRYRLPVAAAFVFAASGLVFYQFRAAGPDHARPIPTENATLAVSAPSSAEGATVAYSETNSLALADRGSAAIAPAPREPAVAVVVSDTKRSQTTGGRPQPADFMSGKTYYRSDTPSARSIAVNLAAAQASEPGVVRNLLGFSGIVDARLVPERASVADPLARMTPPSQVRRSQLLAQALPAAYAVTEAAPPSADRLVRRLNDDRLYGSVSRYDVGGSQFAVSIKF